MDLFLLSLIFSMILNKAFALPSNNRQKRDDYDDNDEAESLYHGLGVLPDGNIPHEFFDYVGVPHEHHHEFGAYSPPAPAYGVPAPAYGVPAPVGIGVGVTVDKQAVLAPKVELFRFIEAFIQFKKELIARLQHLLNDNWDLILAIINLVIGKLQKLQGFTLVFISILRQIFEFAVGLFSAFNINLPSVSVGISGQVNPISSLNVNVPDILSTISGLWQR